ncbi:hypothetical protein mRhiFer1_008870 [Rhinolophus ferrumequinum]|uniref:Uncharacterized protein n=1 Tax=Rhinolophus ferrumequinum TaxID=59479 RepID=A0A7J8AFQ2_RHIFE|nr:hypothetical protein mRhiFer1_008870 [Rhinolophus ferrumequinum]
MINYLRITEAQDHFEFIFRSEKCLLPHTAAYLQLILSNNLSLPLTCACVHTTSYLNSEPLDCFFSSTVENFWGVFFIWLFLSFHVRWTHVAKSAHCLQGKCHVLVIACKDSYERGLVSVKPWH